MSIKKILNEVDRQNEFKQVLKELYSLTPEKLLASMNDTEEVTEDKDELPNESWEEIIELINQSYSEYQKEWEEELYKVKFKILCNKYFTKQEFISLDELERKLKFEIKKFYSSLNSYLNLEDFKNRFFNLPIDMLFSFTRYILNSSNALNKRLVITKEEFKRKVEELKKERIEIANKISFISNKNGVNFNLSKLKELIEYGVFYEDNFLNRGVLEYVYKLSSHAELSEKIKEQFNNTFLFDLQKEVEESVSYRNHISAITKEEYGEYFTDKGVQIGRRFDNELEIVKSKKENPNLVVDKNSIYKEPYQRIKQVNYAWETESTAQSGGTEGSGESESLDSGGDFSGGSSGGGFSDIGGSAVGAEPGSEVVDVDLEGSGESEMPKTEDGLPVDFGTPESNGIENNTEEEPEEDK